MTARSHTLRVRLGVPGVLVRLLLVAVSVAGAFLLVPVPAWRGVAIVAALVGAVVPWSLASWIAGASIALGTLLADPSPAQTAIAVLVVHAVHVLASLAWTIPAAAWLSVRALGPTVLRFVVVQVIAQSIAFSVALLAEPETGPGIAGAAAAGAAVLVVAVGVGLYALRRADSAAEQPGTAPESRSGADVGGPA